MGKGQYLILAFVGVVVFYGIKLKQRLYHVPPLPNFPLDQYWGPGEAPATTDKSIRKFEIKFDPGRLKNLLTCLDDEGFHTEPLEGIGFEYGFNNNYLREVVRFWKTEYNFTEREAYLNNYPHYKTNIQGLDIHFIHVKPNVRKNVDVLPMLMLHGWPGSVKEFYGTIPLLTNPKKGYDFVFELIIPSLPGFGYSQGASKQGLGPAHMAVIMRNLMERLGFDKYYIHGGDWGAVVTSSMAILYPEKVLGYHTNSAGSISELSMVKLLLGSLYPSLVVDKKHESKVYPLINFFDVFLIEAGYAHLQATKPDTIGAALKSSPVALASYIIEKFSVWTNPEWIHLRDGGITKKFTLTDILDNVMIYWSSGCITTAGRIYAENFSKNELDLKLDNIPIKVPTAIAIFENEVVYMTDWQLSDKYPNIVQKTEYEIGGHFAAFEEPQLFANDIWIAVAKFNIIKNAL